MNEDITKNMSRTIIIECTSVFDDVELGRWVDDCLSDKVVVKSVSVLRIAYNMRTEKHQGGGV